KEPGDGGIDHFGGYRGYTILGQCKNYPEPGSIGPQYLRDLEGVLSRYHKYTTIGILVAPSKASFSKNAINRAKSSEYIIILTGITEAYSDLVQVKVRIEELERNRTDIVTENAELRDRVTKLEQKQSQDDAMHGSYGAKDQRSLISEISTTSYPSNPKSLEEIETDNFLNLESKKEVSNMMRERNKEKKLLRGNEAPASQTKELKERSLALIEYG
ncbi:24233_t:CDS:2, partial [Gigaspora margarita]